MPPTIKSRRRLTTPIEEFPAEVRDCVTICKNIMEETFAELEESMQRARETFNASGVATEFMEAIKTLYPENPIINQIADYITERSEEIPVHQDVAFNADGQLLQAAASLISPTPILHADKPSGWDYGQWDKLRDMEKRSQLLTAITYIAAEIQRLDYLANEH